VGAAGVFLPLLLTAGEAAGLCGVSKATWYRMHAAGKIPLPVRLGRSVRWRREELESWIRAGCPAREKWVAYVEAHSLDFGGP
jgi:excisionase family DNA binding protein